MDMKYVPLVTSVGLYLTIIICVVTVCFAVMHIMTVRLGGQTAAESVGKFYNSLLSLNGIRLATIVFTIIGVVILNLTDRMKEPSTVAILSGVMGYLFGQKAASGGKSRGARSGTAEQPPAETQ